MLAVIRFLAAVLAGLAAAVAAVVALTISAAIVFSIPASAQNEPRHALVVGNAAYGMGALKNPINDARAMASVLIDSGFETTLVEDVTSAGFDEAVDAYLAGVPEGAVSVFYYAGHAVQKEGRNYLLPVDISVDAPDQILGLGLSASDLVDRFHARGIAFGIFILDACRDNPFAADADEIGRGLASMESEAGETLIAFATQAGEVAYDGTGPNSPYTGALVTEIDKEGRDILDVFRSVRRSVRIWTDGRQRPFISASIERQFSFRPEGSVEEVQVDTGDLSFDRVRDVIEQIWWAAIRDSRNPEDFRAFVAYYPESENVVLARNLTVDLERSGVQVRGLELAQFVPDEEVAAVGGLADVLTRCDISAADPDDPRRISDGVPWGLVNMRLALRDCSAALADDPRNPRLLHQMGRLLDIQGRYAEAEGFYRLAASLDYSAAQVNLGYLFSAGQGREIDFDAAMGLYRQAAELGNLRARTNIGVYYERGWGVEANLDEAALWYRLAAQNGWPNALDTLANLYRRGKTDDGRGLEQDVDEAIRLYKVASELGNTNAMNNLGQIYIRGDTGTPDVEEGIAWLQRASDRGNRYAPFNLGRYYRDGNNVEQNDARAVEYFRQAMDVGMVPARIALGRMYQDGRGVPQDRIEAGFHFVVAELTGDARKADEVEEARKRLQELGLSDADLAEARDRAAQWVRNNGR